jgi:WD40 repeat protein
MNTKRSQFILFVPVLLLMLIMAACQPQAQPLAGPDPTAVAASVEAYFSETATQPATAAATPEPVVTDEPKTIDTGSATNTLLPAPLYFLSMQSGSWQIWRIEMNGGFPRQVIDLPAPVSDFDISPVDGRLAYVSGNDLYVAFADGSNAQMVINGEDVDPDKGHNPTLSVASPRWSPDGRELAFSLNGVNVVTLETGVVRMLITNQVSEQDKFINWRSYFPVYWSPDGNYIATQIGYYEGTGLTVLPANGGAPLVDEVFFCCDITPAEDPAFFYIASAMFGYGDPGMWKVEWATGAVTRLTEEQSDFSNLIAYSHPLLRDGELYFVMAKERYAAIARTSPADLQDVEILVDAPYSPLEALWSPDASLLVVTGNRPDLPLQIWWSTGEVRPLELAGRILKWGVVTEADIAFAATPAPEPTPVVIPTLPASAQPITVDNVRQLRLLAELDKDENVYGLAISPDNNLLALGLTNRVRIYDLNTMTRLADLKPYRDIIPALDFSPDSRYLAVGSWDRSLDLYEMASFQKVKTFEGHNEWINAVKFSPDGRSLASASNDLSMILWDLDDGSSERIISTDNWVGDVDFSADGRLIAATAWNEAAYLFDATSVAELRRIARPTDQWALNLAFSPDSQTLVMGTWNYDVVLYDMATYTERAVLRGHNDNPTGMAFSADGRLLATADEAGQLRFWDLNTGAALFVMKGTRILDISTDGRLLVTGADRIEGVALYYVP